VLAVRTSGDTLTQSRCSGSGPRKEFRATSVAGLPTGGGLMRLHRVRHALEVESSDFGDILTSLARLLVFLEQSICFHIRSLELLEFDAHAPAADIAAIELGSSALPCLECSATFL